jgi:hypothetical protein
MQCQRFLLVTALSEGATGIALLATPASVLVLLLGVSQSAAETLISARLAGAALVALGLACWLARNDRPTLSQAGLMWGMLFYDVAAALLLALAGARWALAGVGLWPAVGLHCGLAVWCLTCLANNSRPPAGKNY